MSDNVIPLNEIGKIGTVKVYNQAYVDNQQKRIAELEDENKHIYTRMTRIDKVLDEKTEKIVELEAQITDMKNYCCEVSKYLHDYSGVEQNSPECRKRDILLIKELKLCEKWGDLR